MVKHETHQKYVNQLQKTKDLSEDGDWTLDPVTFIAKGLIMGLKIQNFL